MAVLLGKVAMADADPVALAITAARAPRAGRPRWYDIAPAELRDWNQRLRSTEASLLQYPYWNEGMRYAYFTPRYLAYARNGIPEAYVCILTVGVPGLRVGVVQHGPVSLLPSDAEPLQEALPDLVRWARSRGYILLRFSHTTAEAQRPVRSLRWARALDAFPIYRSFREELVVPINGDDQAMLASFQPTARRNIKQAIQAGYRIEASDRPEAMEEIWPLFERLAQRKGLRFYKPPQSYATILRLARPTGGAKVFVAYRDAVALQAILVVRDRSTAHYVIGALDTEQLGEQASPSVLLHWSAMQEFARVDSPCSHYDLGTRSGSVYRFKQKFHPVERLFPPPVTVVTNAFTYALWSSAALPAIERVWPRIKTMLYRLQH